ncbi:LON peptidase substrate-binding domain-containing protein [Kiloniella laminariae]|uniref:LON peptidase substrate-binding domain-containing protein n=1 Tax=Kiloniella laminariae TaxID=454162 RepID=UPI0003619688|nr:LON peptidase substrate-binding domain-containing protein [Kiloniella laminariae]
MTRGFFDPKYSKLPEDIPLFPLAGALLLPGGTLPLNVFEPRYLTMVDHALSQARCIGMIQPCQESKDEGTANLYNIGCLGRITSFMETDDGRYLISLQGLIRFKMTTECNHPFGFRQARCDYSSYRSDIEESGTETVDRTRLLKCLESYFEINNINADWKAIEHTENSRLVNTLAMICPFSAAEKQAILEARTLSERAEVMETIMDMAIHQKNQNLATQ